MASHKPKSVKRIILQIISGILIACLLLAVGSLVIQKVSGRPQVMILGWGGAMILTGSMEPTIPTGSLIIIHKQNEYHVGDAITYIDDRDRAVTHRVTEVTGDTIVTQGDANNAADKPFDKSQVVGKVVSVMPRAGRVLNFLRDPLVLGIIVVIMAMCWLLPYKNERKVEDEIVQVQEENEHGS